MNPLVSVLMPVRNGADYLVDAAMSILSQTYDQFEFIIVDDGSTDATPSILQALANQDSRIKVMRSMGPHGVANALNLGLAQCQGRYIARHDADDLARPQRLERQVAFMDQYPDIDIIGSWIELIDSNGTALRLHGEPVTPAAIYLQSFFGTPFAHPSVMLRRESLAQMHELYREIPAQDYDLWVRMLNKGLRGSNLTDALVQYRVTPESDSHVRAEKHSKVADEIAHTQLVQIVDDSELMTILGSPRCKQIAHALICGVPFDYHPGDQKFGDSILRLLENFGGSIPGMQPSEWRDLYAQLENQWYPIRARLATLTQLARRPRWLARHIQWLHRCVQYGVSRVRTYDKHKFIAQVPVIINTRDRVSDLVKLVDWLRLAGHRRIILLDNGSTYPPLCEYLDQFEGHVVRLERNLGHTALWEVEDLSRIIRHEWFVYTDPDVIPTIETPKDAVAYFFEVLLRNPKYIKAGFGLKIDDLPDRFKARKNVVDWETKQYRREIEPGVFEADIDTTFALYRPGTPYCYGPALRTVGLYEARHMPWYVDSAKLTEEEDYYRKHALKTVTTWSGDLSSVPKNA